jgi:hypothetical protein
MQVLEVNRNADLIGRPHSGKIRDLARIDEVLDVMEEHRNALVKGAFYYIRSEPSKPEEFFLCRIVHGGGRVFFQEQVEHCEHGISDDDLMYAVRHSTVDLGIPGHYHISPHIEKKLRTLLEP